MKAEYTKAQDIIGKARTDLNRIIEAMQNNKTLEDHEAYETLDNIIDRLESAEDYLNYLNSPAKYGILQEDPDAGKYYIAYDDGTQSYFFSCGSRLEMLIDGEWFIGRVEARDGQYYFYAADKPFLSRGMSVRKRVDL